MSDIDLYLDQDNELKFNVSIEGSKPGTPKYRLVFEGKDFSYSFAGQQTAAGEVCIVIPTMKNLMKEGNYRAQLEVMIDDRYFSPLEFTANFEQSVRVVAEHTSRSAPKKVGVTASFANTARPAPTAQPTKIVEKAAPVQQRPVSRAPVKEAIAEIDGKPVSVDDLRALLRSRIK